MFVVFPSMFVCGVVLLTVGQFDFSPQPNMLPYAGFKSRVDVSSPKFVLICVFRVSRKSPYQVQYDLSGFVTNL